MVEAARWVGAALGLALVACTFASMVDNLIVPRPARSRIAIALWLGTRRLFLLVARRLPTYEARDAWLALLAPAALVVLFLGWLLLFLLGYALIAWPWVGAFSGASKVAGSSLFTLGLASSPGTAPTAVEFAAAATGMFAVAIQIAYLPTIYSAYSKREALMTVLASRAGDPAWGPELLARQVLVYGHNDLPQFFGEWERWMAEVTESHANYPWLLAFRSPHPHRSWLISLLAVMDAAALYLALTPRRAPTEARRLLRMGAFGLQTLCVAHRVPFNPDPRPDDPLRLTREEFMVGADLLRRAGFPIERDDETAWPHFRGWRVTYEAMVERLAEMNAAVPAPWSGPRSLADGKLIAPSRPRHRTPEDPEARDPRVLPPPILGGSPVSAPGLPVIAARPRRP